MNKESNNILSRRIQELKEQYELKMESKTSILPMKLAKNACQSRVKEISKVFNNNMMKQVLQRDAGEIKYKRFANDTAPQLQSSPIVPKLRTKFLPSSERVTPIPAKRTCVVTENAFNKLSVKDRVKLYSKFIEDLSKNKYNTETAPIIVEKEASVELILKAFEGKLSSTEHQSIKQPLKKMVNNFQKMPSISSKMNEYENLTYSGGKPIVNKELTPLKQLFYKWLSEHDGASYTKDVEHAELIPENQTSSTIDTLKRSNINTFVENSLMKFESNNIKEVEDVMMETSNFCDYENIKQLITDKYMEDTLEKFLIDDTKQVSNFNYEKDSTVLISDKVVDSTALLLLDYSEDGNAINFDSPQSFKSTEISDADKFTDALTEIESEDSAPNDGEIVNIEDTESEEEPQKIILQAGALSISLPPLRNIPSMTSESSGEDHSPVKLKKFTDSESGLSTLPKVSSDDSPQEKRIKNKFGQKLKEKLLMPLIKPVRKRYSKVKQTTKLNNSEEPIKTKKTVRRKPSYIKQLFGKKSTKPATDDQTDDTVFINRHEDLMRAVNSPRKINAAYTLTCLTPIPSTSSEAEHMRDCFKTAINSRQSNNSVKEKTAHVKSQSPCQSKESSYDQGIETDIQETPCRVEEEKKNLQRNPVCKYKIDFSTPIKGHEGKVFPTSSPEKRFTISPIIKKAKTWPRSYRDIEFSPRSSVIMEAIPEDKPLQTHDLIASRHKRQSVHSTDSTIFKTPQSSKNSTIKRRKTSEFWIKCGDFSFVFDIDYETPEKLRWKYEMFTKVSMETREAYFGIDNYMFTWNQPLNNTYISTRHSLQCRTGSQYYITTGNLAIPFKGVHLNSQKIKNYFQFISSAVQETRLLEFGVDNVDFSKIPEFIYNTSKLSLDSQVSQLIGLQTGSSDNLEGFQRNHWPRIQPKIISMVPDEEQSDRPSLSTNPFSSINFDLSSFDFQQRHSDLKMVPYESDSLDALFPTKVSRKKSFDKSLLMATIQKTKSDLLRFQDRLNNYKNEQNISNENLDNLRGSPEYHLKLKNLIFSINKLCENNYLQNCSKKELESYMYALTSYTDLCLSDCIGNIDKVFNALDEKSVPPENELQKSHDQNPAALSEHQLRIQASLQRLNIPDWFRQYNQIQTSTSGGAGSATYRPGNFTRKRTQDSGRWAGLNSKTTSLSSLGSQRSDRSPLLLSPSAHSHHGGQSSISQQHQHHPHHSHHVSSVVGGSGGATAGGAGAFSRWSTSHLNSSQISPCVSQRSSFSRGGPINSSFMSVASGHNSAIRNSMRQPYLGWRSQEKLSQRTAHERLASSLLSQHQHQQQQRPSSTTRQTLSCITNTDDDAVTAQAKLPPPITPEIQTSIKEVTSAIVHYVNDQTNQQRSRSTSPNSRKCWLESSFVGTRPLDSPQTPIIENTTFSTAAIAATGLLSITNNNNNNTTTPSLNNYQQYKITPTGIDIGIGDHHHHHQHHQHHHHLASSSSVYNSSRIGIALGNEAVLTRMNGSGGLNNGATTATFGGSVSSGVVAGSGGVGVDNITEFGSLAAAPERSLSSASLEDVLTSLLGLSTTHHTTVTTTADPSGRTLASTNTINIDAFARSSTGGASASECLRAENKYKHMPQQQQQHQQQQQQITTANDYEQQKENIEQIQQQSQLLSVLSKEEQQHLRRRSEGDAPTQKAKQQQQQQQQQQQNQKLPQYGNNGKTYASDTLATSVAQAYGSELQNIIPNEIGFMPPRRISLGDSTESNHKTISASGELQIKCRNTKCDRTATPVDAKKYYKSCHNCTHLYCSRECRRAHWEKHRKACLHSRASNLCRQVLATCKDDVDSQRHLSFLARQGFLSQGRGVVRMLFRSAEAAEGFIKHGFQCMGEASYVRWPDLMPAEMGLELYSELLRFSTEYKPESKMLVYVAICVVSEAPSMGQAPVRWERQLVSRCAKLKLCKTVLTDYEQASSNRQQQHSSQPLTTINVHEPTTDVLILTFNPQLRSSTVQRELIFSNILTILSRRGVVLRRHYPEIFQRLQTFTEGQTDKFHPVTLHPRNSQTGQNFVCIIMPVQSESEIIKLPSAADGGNRVTTIDVGSAAAPMQLDDEELLAEATS